MTKKHNVQILKRVGNINKLQLQMAFLFCLKAQNQPILSSLKVLVLFNYNTCKR